MLTPQELEARRTVIGSSDIPALAGVDEDRGPMDIFLAKTMPEPERESPAGPIGRQPIRWGHKLEDLVIDAWMEHRNIDAARVVRRPPSLHYGETVAAANLDAMRLRSTTNGDDRLICEAKTTGLRAAEMWEHGQTPDKYACQVQWQMGVSGIPRADLCVLIDGQDFQIRELAFDKELFHDLLMLAESFWSQYIEKNRPPPMDATDATLRYLRQRFPREVQPMLPADDTAKALKAKIDELNRAQKIAEMKLETAKNELKAIIGDAEGIAGVATYKTRQGYHVDAFDVAPTRVLRMK